MNILFLTIAGITDISERGIYTDLVRYFQKQGHHIAIACPVERRCHQRTNLYVSNGVSILNVKTLNIQKTNLIEKTLATLTLEDQFLKAIKTYYATTKFDLVIYSTPPITFSKIIEFLKKRDQVKSYLLLKDIFPQNAVDLGMIKEKGLIHKFFRKKEERLYAISDYIGCMSPANVEFVLEHNKNLDPSTVEVNPNSLEPINQEIFFDKLKCREKYGIPEDALVFIYGGNLGKPQGIEFLLEVLKSNKGNKNLFFMIVGTGTAYGLIDKWIKYVLPSNIILIQGLPKVDYDDLVKACDIGLIFLDRRFKIPNFPSRLLSYLENKLPIIAATDINTDIGKIAEAEKFGMWCESGDLNLFNKIINRFLLNPQLSINMGLNGYEFLMKNYHVANSYNIIMKHFNDV